MSRRAGLRAAAVPPPTAVQPPTAAPPPTAVPPPETTPTAPPMSDEDKFSTRTQWQERSSRPVAARPMTVRELEEFRQVLQINEGVTPEGVGVSVNFVPITNRAADEDAGEYIYLIYKSATRIGPGGTFHPTTVWKMKIPIPDYLKPKYDAEMRARGYYDTPAPVRHRPALAANAQTAAASTAPARPTPKRR